MLTLYNRLQIVAISLYKIPLYIQDNHDELLALNKKGQFSEYNVSHQKKGIFDINFKTCLDRPLLTSWSIEPVKKVIQKVKFFDLFMH